MTGPGISHAGDFSVYDWYQINVVPLLGNGPSFVNPGVLTASQIVSASNPQSPPVYSGTVAPGATVEILGYAKSKQVSLGMTTADATGHWSISAPMIVPGTYRIYAQAHVPVAPGLRGVFVQPRVPVAGVTIV